MDSARGGGEATAEDTRRSAAGDEVPAGRAVVSVAHDADEQARNLVGWRQTYDQLAAGHFVGTLTELPLDTMKLFRETTSHTLRQACEVRGDAYWFGIPVLPPEFEAAQMRIDTRPVAADGFACRPGNVEFELLTPAAFSIYGVVVRGEVLRRHAEQVERAGFDESVPRQAMVRAGDARLARLRALLASRLDPWPDSRPASRPTSQPASQFGSQSDFPPDSRLLQATSPRAAFPMASAMICRRPCWLPCSTSARGRPAMKRPMACSRSDAAASLPRRATTCSRIARAQWACPSFASNCT